MLRPWPLLAGVWIGLTPLAAAAQPNPEPEPTGASDEEPGDEPEGEAPGAKPSSPRPPTEEPEEAGPEPPLIPPALDTLSGHWMLSPSAGLAIPFGSLEESAAQADTMSSGWAFGVDLAYGLTRTVAIGAWGQMLTLGSTDLCRDCSTKSTAFGAFVRYHLVQGMRFDPWMAAGLGYRMTTISVGTQDVDYSGFEWLRVQVGGDWYAFDKIGFGPFMELDLGRYGSRSPGEIGEGANHWHFLTGARITLDLPGK